MGRGLRTYAAAAALGLGAAAAAGALLLLALTVAPRDGLDFRVYLAGGQSVVDATGELYSVSIPNGPNQALALRIRP